jgi:hypothetical protein
MTPPTSIRTLSCTALYEHDHLLSRVLLTDLHSVYESSLIQNDIELSRVAENLSTFLITIHNAPEKLFLSSFDIELTQVKNLAAVMRERTVSVIVLQYLWKLYDTTTLIRPLVRLCNKLKPHHLLLLTNEPTPSAPHKREALKNLFLDKINTLFKKSLPTCLPHLCYKASQLISLNSSVDTQNISIVEWIIGSFVFLRFFVPSMTDIISDENISESQKKASRFVGRFLMKLSCKSFFNEHPNCLANEILTECFPLFDAYCVDVLYLGSKLVAKEIPQLPMKEYDGTEILHLQTDFGRYLVMNESKLLSNCQRELENEKKSHSLTFALPRISANEIALSLFSQLKLDLCLNLPKIPPIAVNVSTPPKGQLDLPPLLTRKKLRYVKSSMALLI